MSHLMDYGPDWPPAVKESLSTPRRRSLWRWLNARKTQQRRGFDRNFWVNVLVTVTAFAVILAGLKLSELRPMDLQFRPAPSPASAPHH